MEIFGWVSYRPAQGICAVQGPATLGGLLGQIPAFSLVPGISKAHPPMTLSFPCSVGYRTGTSAAMAKLESQEQINPWSRDTQVLQVELPWGSRDTSVATPEMVLPCIQSLWEGQQ